MIAADTSVAVAAFAEWHEKHESARRVIDAGARLVAHCALETYSVLTRLPVPHRAPSSVARDYLATRFPEAFLRLSETSYRAFLKALPDLGIAGGATYDALVAATAAAEGADLWTCDRRALPVYERYAVRAVVL